MSQDLIATHFGDIIVTHGPDDCRPPCTIHSPSDHHMVTWPQHWRGDRKIMERVCPHGVGHPDPDDIKVCSSVTEGVRGCDGCCAAPGSTDDGPLS